MNAQPPSDTNQSIWTFLRRCFAAFVVLLLFHSLGFASSLTHRYSFQSNADDSIGTAHGTLLGDALIDDGKLILNGTNGVLELPNDLLTNHQSLTIEAWFKNTKPLNSGAQYLWSFKGLPFNFVITSPWIWTSGGSYGAQEVACVPLPNGIAHHLVWTQDALSHTARIYLNGHLFAENTSFTVAPGPFTACYLGGEHAGEPIEGYISEFRVYSNGLTHLEVLQSESLGPDTPPTDGEVLTDLHLHSSSHLGLGTIVRPLVHADFTLQQGVNITPLPDIGFHSNDTNVVTSLDEGYLSAVGLGVAEISATYAGLSSTAMVSVVAGDQFALAHRYDFNGIPGATVVKDLVGGAHGVVASIGQTFTDGGQLYLTGRSYVDLPDGLLSSLSEVTVEAWVTGIRVNGRHWPRVFDFGSYNGFGGESYFFLSPSVLNDNASSDTQLIRFAISTNSIIRESTLTTMPWMADNFETHFAVAYSPSRNVSKLYVNGIPVDAGPAPYALSLINDENNWLGRSQYSMDDYFRGLFKEFRVYRNALTDSQVAASYALGPDVAGADFALLHQLSDTNLVLSWGPSASWCELEGSSSIAPGAIWTNVPTMPSFTNGHLEVAVPITEATRFFRLASP